MGDHYDEFREQTKLLVLRIPKVQYAKMMLLEKSIPRVFQEAEHFATEVFMFWRIQVVNPQHKLFYETKKQIEDIPLAELHWEYDNVNF